MGSFTRLALLFSALLTGCKQEPPFYAMPAQQLVPPLVPIKPVSFVRLSDEDVNQYIVRDVAGGADGSAWRWSNNRPEFKFPLEKNRQYTATMEFTISDKTFADTGPVTIEYSVGSRLLKSEIYRKPGNYVFREPVPSEWIDSEFTTFSAQITPVWVSRSDGARLGVSPDESRICRKLAHAPSLIDPLRWRVSRCWHAGLQASFSSRD